jgi:hypothetical protein
VLFPSDLKDIQKHLVKQNFDLTTLQYYVMLLNALDGALRFDGLHEVSFADFEREEVRRLW